MSGRLEGELSQLLEECFVDASSNHNNRYSRFFASNKEELRNPIVWGEMKSQITEELAYKIMYENPDIADEFINDLNICYKIWSSNIKNVI